MKKWSLLIAFAISFSVLTGCNKYEEGPIISLKTKKARIVGEWELVTFNDLDQIVDYPGNSFSDDFGDCGVQTIIPKILKQKNVVWDFESDNDIKQRYVRVELDYIYGESYQSPECVAYYSTEDSSATTDLNKWLFNNDKQELRIQYQNGQIEDYQILRLTGKEMKLEDLDGNILTFNKR